MWNLILLWIMSINSLNVPIWVWVLAWIELIFRIARRIAVNLAKDNKRW
jgi:hypothetical protein